MTQEEKQLLLVDLCTRLPYGVMVEVSNEKYFGEIKEPYITELCNCIYLLDDDSVCIKPYLRPMSSMTDDERMEYFVLHHRANDRDDNVIDIEEADELVTWLYKHHFDFHKLIWKDLAMVAPEEMYKNCINK